jgi:hypothetical protein
VGGNDMTLVGLGHLLSGTVVSTQVIREGALDESERMGGV